MDRGILLQKMKQLNFPDALIDYLKDYYTHDSIITNAAGATTAKQYQSRGLRQGCPLSSILFVIYLIELGPRLDNSGLGVNLGDGVIIAYLKFADDIVLASASESGLEELKCILEGWCFNFRMRISQKKTQVITPTNSSSWSITDLSDEVGLLELQRVQEYTYLGVTQKLSVNATAHKKSESMVQRAITYKNSLLRMRSTVPDKTDTFRAAWENVAVPSILYGADVLPVTQETIDQIDDVQHIVAKVLLRIPKSSVNLAALVELGMKPFHLRILEVKLRFYIKVTKHLNNCKTTQPCMDLLKNSSHSEYLSNLSDLLKPIDVSISNIDDQTLEKLASYHKSLVYGIFKMKTMRLMPLPISWWKKGAHVEEGSWSKSLSRFRTMNAGLGNRDTCYRDYAMLSPSTEAELFLVPCASPGQTTNIIWS